MSERIDPKKIQPGQKVTMQGELSSHVAFFVERFVTTSRKPINIFRVPSFDDLDGPDSKGFCEMNDKEARSRITINC